MKINLYTTDYSWFWQFKRKSARGITAQQIDCERALLDMQDGLPDECLSQLSQEIKANFGCSPVRVEVAKVSHNHLQFILT